MNESKNDITSEQDIKLLVDSFYKKVIVDPVIGFIFTELANFSWDKHIPVMYSFWSSILLGAHSYAGNPMVKHIDLNKLIPLNGVHF